MFRNCARKRLAEVWIVKLLKDDAGAFSAVRKLGCRVMASAVKALVEKELLTQKLPALVLKGAIKAGMSLVTAGLSIVTSVRVKVASMMRVERLQIL